MPPIPVELDGSAVAQFLGQEWSFDNGAVAGSLQHRDGRRLQLQATADPRTRIIVNGLLPDQSSTARLSSHRITVAANRGPVALAHEITRRLLPRYDEEFALVQRQLEADRRDAEQRAAVVDQVLTLLPGSRVVGSSGPVDRTEIRWQPYAGIEPSFAVVAYGGGTVHITGRWLPPTIAVRVCRGLAAACSIPPPAGHAAPRTAGHG